MRHDFTPGVWAYVNVDGVPLEEFGNEEDAEQDDRVHTATYVEAAPGATFTVSVVFDDHYFPYPKDDIHCAMYLDGELVQGKLRDIKYKKNLVEIKERSEVLSTGTYVHKFQFAELATHDGSVQEGLKEKLKHLGNISVRLIRCEVRGTMPGRMSRAGPQPVAGESIPEKGLKGRAISTKATLGAREKVRDKVYVDVNYKYGMTPFAVFTFKYRSHKDLQIEGIIPRSPSPAPLEERDPATLNADELRQLLARRNAELKDVKVKREKRERPSIDLDEDDEDEDALVVTDSRSKRRRTSRDSGIEVVDLTDD